MALLKKWFCCQLHTGAVVIGWIEAVGCLISSIILGILLGSLDTISDAVQPLINERQFSDNQANAAAYFIKMDAKIWLSIFLILTIVNLIASSSLILGAMQSKRLLLLPWLVGKTINNVVSGIFLLIVFIGLLASSNVHPGLIFLYIFSLFYYAFHVYVWLCIHSLFCKIREDEFQTDNVQMLPKDGNMPYTQFV